jgi:hypothetical protein
MEKQPGGLHYGAPSQGGTPSKLQMSLELLDELSGERWTGQESATLGSIEQFCPRTPWLALELFIECEYTLSNKNKPHLYSDGNGWRSHG